MINTEKYKEELVNRRTELQSRLERTHRHIFEKKEPVSPNFHEQATQTENDQLVITLDKDAKIEIAQINSALQRIEDGVYDTCVACNGRIEQLRLQAIPYTDRCIQCAKQPATTDK